MGLVVRPRYVPSRPLLRDADGGPVGDTGERAGGHLEVKVAGRLWVLTGP